MENVQYKGNGGFVRDFVELPSQLNEHWAFEPEVLKVYAKHYQTGEVIPQSLVERVQAAGKYGQGFATVEYLAASYLDMDFHVLKEIPADFDVMAFEDKVLSQRGNSLTDSFPIQSAIFQPHLWRRIHRRLLQLHMGGGSGCRCI